MRTCITLRHEAAEIRKVGLKRTKAARALYFADIFFDPHEVGSALLGNIPKYIYYTRLCAHFE